MATINRFEDLIVWQKARALAKKVYALTFQPPISTDFRYKDQIRGTAGSIMDNIAEGFERRSRFEFIYSLGVAAGEAGELKSQLYRGLDINYIEEMTFSDLYSDTDEVTKMIVGFIAYLNRSELKGQKFKGRK